MGKTFKSVISYLYFPICILLYPLLIKNSLAMADFRQWQEHFKIKELGTFALSVICLHTILIIDPCFISDKTGCANIL